MEPRVLPGGDRRDHGYADADSDSDSDKVTLNRMRKKIKDGADAACLTTPR